MFIRKKLFLLKNFYNENKYSSLSSPNKKVSFLSSSISKIVFNILAFIFLLNARYLYIKSLFGCDGDEFKCIINSSMKYILDDIYYCTHSALFFSCFLFIFHLKLCSLYQILIFILIIFELIVKDRGDSFLHHGILNLSALFILVIIGEFIIFIIILLLNLIKNKKYFHLTQFFIIIILLYILLYINTKNNYYCKDWSKGLNDSYIINNESIYSCSINIPKNKCLIDILSPIFDLSNILHIHCNKRKEKEKFFLKEISNLNNTKDIKKIGFPITIGDKEEIKGRPAMYSNTLLDFVKNNLINLDNEKQLELIKENRKPEVYVDFSENPYGKLTININYSKDLSEKRLALSNKNDGNNILFIYLDNLSRVHFYRQFKKTSNFLKQFLSFEGFSSRDESEQIYHGFEFLKYHNFKRATLHNAIPMFSGVYYKRKNKMVSIVKKIKELGYITGSVQDICHKELMSIGKFKKYSFIEFDHEYAAPNCDPNVYKYGFGLFSGENGMLRKCLYGKDSIEHAFEYGKKFWLSYKNNKRFLRVVNTYAHEYSGEKAKYSDDALFTFLKELYNSNQLKNTTVFIAGDHGFALMGVHKLINPNDWKIEQSLPIFILIVPDKKNESYEKQYSQILQNQQTLITPFDIYYTIRDIILGNEYKKDLLKEQKNEGESLFKYINPKERNCTKYERFGNCQCKLNN